MRYTPKIFVFSSFYIFRKCIN